MDCLREAYILLCRRRPAHAGLCSERTVMGTKTGLLIGVCIGYVLGARAGKRNVTIRSAPARQRFVASRLLLVRWMRPARRCPTSCARAAGDR